MKKVTDFLGIAIEAKAVLPAARAQTVLKQWDSVLGPMLATKVVVEKYDHGTVWVVAEGSAWAQEVRLNSELILGRLNELAGESLFSKIRVSVQSRS